jgi:very-short-patch-repair endonuclease
MPDARSIELARQFRREPTRAEAILWQQLRGEKLNGLRFRRQHPLEGCITDFCCPEKRLVVEVDGDVHLEPENAERDALRDKRLRVDGYTVLCVTNEQVMGDLQQVLGRIAAAAEAIAR